MHVKFCTFLATLWVLVCGVLATDIVTLTGTVYRNAEVKGVDRDGLRISYRDGIAFIPFDTLPSEWQTRYGWTAEKAAAVKAEKVAEAAQAEQKRIVAAQAEQERQRVAAENAQAQAALDAQAAQQEADRLVSEKDAQELAKTSAESERRHHRNKILGIAGLIYFFPSLIGIRKRNGFAILVLNLFLGWTLIGWVAALIWACLRDSQNVVQHSSSTTHHYTFAQRDAPTEDADYTDAPLKPVRGRVLPARERNPLLPPPDDPRLPPRRR